MLMWQLRAVKKKKRPPKCKACGSSKHNHKDCPKRTGRGTTTSSYTPTDIKSDTEHVSDEELTSSGCSGSDVSLDMWCLEDDDLMDIMSDTESKHKKGMVKLKREGVREVQRRKEWSLKHGQGTCSEDLKVAAKGSQVEKPKCKACGSSTHRRSNHKDCPKNKGRVATTSSQRGCTATGVESDFEHQPDKELTSSDSSDEESTSSDSGSDVSSDVWCLEDDIIDMVSMTQCTCGAEGRAHKKDCPMNSRHRYPGRTLFPPPGGDVGISPVPDGGLEPPGDEAAPRERGKAPPAKKKKVEKMKVGDYVCIHSGLLGERHLPCRIVRDLGNRYQLYCPKGVLTNSFSGSELDVPPSKCASIPLHGWRQAPRISLRSLARDVAVTEHCDCSLPEKSEYAIILSSSEDEDVGCGMWIKNLLYALTHDDQRVVVSPTGWLTDKVIAAAQMLLLQHFPNMLGLQPPTLQEVLGFQVHSREFVQIIHVRNNHWCVVSTVGCENGAVNVYDSLYSSVSSKTIHLIASMTSSSAAKLVVRMMDVEKQSNGSDCGVLAIAYAFDICSGFNPCRVRFDHRTIRQHLSACLERCQFSRFPVCGERKSASVRSSKTVDLHCSCRMPEQPGDEMAECDKCHVWYHRHCMDIPSEVFGNVEVSWQCKACCDST